MPQQEPLSVLVVEDDQTVGTFLDGIFTSQKWRVRWVETAEDGIGASREDEYDVVLLDLFLPGMSGLEMLRQLKLTSGGPEVVIMTGDPSIDSAVDAMRLGAFDYVEKPVKPKRILHVSEQAAARYRLEREPPAEKSDRSPAISWACRAG